MAVIDFPGSPSAGDSHNQAGLTWVYDGEKWTSNKSSPAWEDKFVNLDGDTMTGNLNVPSLNGGPLAGFRNQIINGDFRIWQRGGDATTSGFGAYNSVDRWAISGNTRCDKISGADVPDIFDFAARLRSTNTDLTVWVKQGYELPKAGARGAFTPGSTWTVSMWTTEADPANVNAIVSFADNVIAGDNSIEIMPFGNLVPTGEVSNTTSQGAYYRYSQTFTVSAAPAASSICVAINFVLTNSPASAPVLPVRC